MAARIQTRPTPARNRNGIISPDLLSQILHALTVRAEKGDAPDGVSTVHELAATLQISEGQARQAAQTLLRAGCIRQRRACAVPSSKTIRYVQAYALAPQGEERGPGRHPRLRALGLIVGADHASSEKYGALLRRDGYLPVSVPTSELACALLHYLAFEVVLALTSATAGVGLPANEAGRVDRAARAAGCGGYVVVNADADMLHLP